MCGHARERERERERERFFFFKVQATVSIAADILVTSGYFILLKIGWTNSLTNSFVFAAVCPFVLSVKGGIDA